MATYYIVNANGYSPVLEDDSFLWTPPAATDAEAYVVGTDAFTAVSDAFAGTKDIYVFSGTYASKNLTLASGRILNLSSDVFAISENEPYTATNTPGGTNKFSVKSFTNNGTVKVGSGVAFDYGDELATVTNTHEFYISGGATVKASFTGDNGTVFISGTLDSNTNITNAENSGNTFVFNGTTTLNGSTISAKAMTVSANVYVNGATVSSTDATINAYIYVQGTSTLDLIADANSTKTISFDNGAELKSSKIKNVALKVRSSNTDAVTIFGENSEIDTILLQGKALNIGKAKVNNVAPVTVLKSKQITTGGGQLTIQNATVQNQDNADLSIVSTSEIDISNSTVSAAITATTGTIEIADSNVSGSLRVSQTAANNTLSGDNTLDVALTGKMAFVDGASLTDSKVTGGELRNESGTITYNGSNQIERTVVKSTLVLDKSAAKEAFLKGDVAGANGTIQINADAVTLSDVAGKQAAQVIQGSVAPTRITNNVSSYYYIDSTAAAKGLYVTLEDDKTLFINATYVAADNSAITTDGHIVGYNAFKDLNAFTYHDHDKNQTAILPHAENIVFADGTYTLSAKNNYLFSDKGIAFAGTGTDGVNLGTGRFILGKALTVSTMDDYTDAYISGVTAPTFTINENLTLTVGQVRIGNTLNYGTTKSAEDASRPESDFDADGNATRTAAKGNLVINGKVNAILYAAPYSTITVNQSGSVYHDGDDNLTSSNFYPNSSMTVTGDKAALTAANKYQVTMKNIGFLDGGSITLNSTRAQISKIRFERLNGDEATPYQYSKVVGLLANENPVVTLNNTYLETVSTYSETLGAGFFREGYGGFYESTDKLTLNLKNGSEMVVHTDFNPYSWTEVNVGLATGDDGSNKLTADSITNSGTINVYSGSTISTGAADNKKNITTTGSINLYGAAGEDKEATLKAYWTYVTGGSFYASYADITSRIQNKASVTIANSTISSNNITNVRGTFTVTDSTVDATKLTVTDGTFSVGGISKLTIGTLTGVLTLDDGAKFSDSSITDGSAGSLLIDADSEVTFYGANTFAATDITNNGNLVVDTKAAVGTEGQDGYQASVPGVLTAGEITNTDATITVNAGSKISATSINGGTIELVGTPVDGDLVVTTDAAGLNSGFVWQYGKTAAESITFTAADVNKTKNYESTYITKRADKITISAIDTNQTTLIVKSDFEGKTGTVEYEGKTYAIGYNAFGNLVDAMKVLETAGIDTKAEGGTVSVTLIDGGADYSKNAEIKITSLNNVLIKPASDAVEVNIASTYEVAADKQVDLQLSSGKNITIDEGVTLNLDPMSYIPFVITLGTITVNGTIQSDDQVWFGGDVTISAGGEVVSGGQVCFRAGFSNSHPSRTTDAVVTVNGTVTATGDLEFTSGNVATGATTISGANFKLSDTHWHSEDTVTVISTGTAWNISGKLYSTNGGVSGFLDSIQLNSGSVLDVNGEGSEVGGLVSIAATGSQLDFTKDLTNKGVITLSGTYKPEETVLPNLTAATLTNNGYLKAEDSAIVNGGAFTNNDGATILMKIANIPTTTTNGEYVQFTVTLTKGEGADAVSYTTEAKVYKLDAALTTNSTDFYAVLAFDKSIADGEYAIMIGDEVIEQKVTIADGVVVDSTKAFMGGNNAVELTGGATLTASTITNYGTISASGASTISKIKIAIDNKAGGNITLNGSTLNGILTNRSGANFKLENGAHFGTDNVVSGIRNKAGATFTAADSEIKVASDTLSNEGTFTATNTGIAAGSISNSGTFGFNKGANASNTKNVIETNSITNSGTFEAANAAITGTTIGDIPTLANTGIFVLDNSSLIMDSVAAGAGTDANKFTVGGASTLKIGYYVDDDNNLETPEILVGGLTGKITVLNGAALSNTAIYKADDTASVEFAAAENGATSGITLADGTVIKADIVNNNANLTVTNLTADAITNNGGLTVNGTVTTGAISNGSSKTTAGTITVNGDLTAGDITNTYGTITIDATDSIKATKIAGGSIILDTSTTAALTIDTNNDEVPDKAPAIITLISGLSSNMSAKVYANSVAEANLIKSGDIITLGSGASAQQYRVSGGSGSKAMTLYSVDDQPQDKLYVKSTYNDTTAAQEGLVFGYNAFANLATALTIAKDVEVAAGKKVEVFLGGTKDTSITKQENLFYGEAFKNDTVIKLGQKEGDAPAARTATIGFKAGDNGLFLNPAAGKNITIDSGVTLKTTAATDNTHGMCGTVYLNYEATTGTVTVDGNIVSATDIYFLGAATVNGDLTVDATIGQLLLRAGKANVAAADGEDQVNKAVTIGRVSGNTIEESQVNGKWIVLVSGDAVFENTVITIGALGYDNYKTLATAHEYDVDPSLTSTNTVWTIGQLKLANEIHSAEPSDATFTFNGGSVGVTHEAELSSFITMNLNGAGLTIGEALTNAGIIGTTDTAATATIKAQSIENTNSITAAAVTATAGSITNGSADVTGASITAGAVTAATDITNYGSITATGSVTATGITNNGTFTADGASVTGAITNNGTFTADDDASVTGTIANNGTFTANGAALGSITTNAETNANASLTFEGAKSTAAYIKNRGATVTIGADLEVAGTFETAALSGKPSVTELQEGKTLTANLLLNGATFNATKATIAAAIKNSGTINATQATLSLGITNSTEGAVFNAIDTALNDITIANSGTFTVKNSDEKLNVTVTGNAIKLDNVQLTDANVVGDATVVSDSTLNGGAFTNLAIAEGSKLDVTGGKLTAGTVAATGTLTLKNSAAIDVTTSIDNFVLDGGVYTTADVTVDETTIPANLKIANLTGTIKLAGTTLNNVTLTSGTFEVAKVLDGEETVATSFTGINSIGKLVVDEGAALTINAAATVADDSKVSLTVNGDFENAGAITIDATGFEWGTSQKFIKVAAITGENITNIGTVSVIGVDDTKYHTMAIVKNDEQGKGIYLYKVDAVVDTTTLYVNKAWAGSYTGDSVEYIYEGGTIQCVFGVNAFADTADLVKYEDTEAIMVKNASNYGAFSWDKAVNVTLNNGEPKFGAVTFGLVNNTSDDDTQTTINGGFTATSLSFGNDALITGSVTTTGAASFEEEAFIDGNLIATGDVTFEDEAEITGNVISNALIFEEDVKVGGNIAATGAVTLGEDTEVGGVFSAGSLTLGTGATLAMAWKYEQDATVAVTDAITAGADSITIDVFDGGLEKVKTNKTVISAGSAVDYASIVANYDASYFTIDGNNLVLDAKKIAKVSKGVDEDVNKGIYNSISQAVGNVNTGLILIVDGNFGNASLKGKQTRVLTSGTVGNTDPTKASYLVGGWNVANLPVDTTSPFYEIYDDYKEFKGSTNVTIENGVFNNAYVIGAELVQLGSTENSVTFYHRGDSNLTITGGKFTAPVVGDKYGERAIAGGLMYNVAKSGVGEAKLIGNVNLTISGGTFEGYDVYGGNYANGNKIYCSNASIKGNITLTLDATTNALNFAANAGGYGGIVQASSFGEGRVQGNTEVILTGSNGIKFEQLVGGSTSDIHVITGKDAEGNDIWELQDSFVTGTRTLTFSGFEGALEFTKIQDFNVVSFEGENTVNFAEGTEGEFHRYFNNDVTTWAFAADADISGNFEFDFSGDTVDLTSFTAASVGEGWTLEHVSMDNATVVKFALESGLTYDYDADAQKFTVSALA